MHTIFRWIFFFSCCCCCCYFITPARHLVHNTQRSYTQSLCSLTLNHSIAYPVLETLFVHLHSHTHTHQCFILNLPLWLLLFFHCAVDVDVVAVACAAGWRLCILLHQFTEPDYKPNGKPLTCLCITFTISLFFPIGHILYYHREYYMVNALCTEHFIWGFLLLFLGFVPLEPNHCSFFSIFFTLYTYVCVLCHSLCPIDYDDCALHKNNSMRGEYLFGVLMRQTL